MLSEEQKIFLLNLARETIKVEIEKKIKYNLSG